MTTELLFQEYNAWVETKKELLNFIVENDNLLSIRIKPILTVIEYFYNKYIDDNSFNDEDYDIFLTGFEYMHACIDQIEFYLVTAYNNDFEQLIDHASDLDLYLNLLDFQDELVDDQEALDELSMIDEAIVKYLISGIKVPQEIIDKLDDISIILMERNNIEYYPISSIYLVIMDELNILEE